MARMFSSGEGYEAMMGRHSRKLAPLFCDFVGIRDSGALLDVGCGTGSLTALLAERTHAAKVNGVDPSRGFVEFAQHRFANDVRVTIREGDALALPFPDRSFEQTFSLLVLMFIENVEGAVTELRRVTRPSGTVAACMWQERGMRMNALFREAALELDPQWSSDERTHHYVPGEAMKLWQDAGLESAVEVPIDIAMEFESFDQYWSATLNGGGPASAYLSELPVEHMEKLRSALRKKHLQDRSDGPYALPARALAVKGIVPS